MREVLRYLLTDSHGVNELARYGGRLQMEKTREGHSQRLPGNRGAPDSYCDLTSASD
jgi:hypothetical protein